jgi:AcrR family transcriptional regulator
MSTEMPPRERILNTAASLFYKDGYRATGIDRVIAESGVAKATFYKYFPSKDELIVAWIDRAEASSKDSFAMADEAEPLFAYVDKVVRIAGSPQCLGCTFQGSAAEFHDLAHPAHAASLRVKTNVLAHLTALAKHQGIADPQKAAELTFLLVEGVWASVRMFGPSAPIAHVPQAIRQLVGAMNPMN